MAIKIKSPNSDDVWEKWKKRAERSQNLEKHYKVKGAAFTLDSITAAEYVKNVNKGAIFFFEESHDIQPSSQKPESDVKNVPKIQKMRFFEFSGKVDKTKWKYEENVPFFNTLEKIKCTKCSGTGGERCSKCNGSGQLTCTKCKGSTSNLKCDSCDAHGTIDIEVDVIDQNGKSSKKQSQVVCKDCLGKKYEFCMKCSGFGKIGCSYCNGMGVNTCSDCKGYGYKYRYSIKAVPFQESHQRTPKLYSSIEMKGLENEVGQEIQKTIESVEGILLRSPKKEFEQKFIEPNLGFFDKPLKKTLKNVVKDFKNAESNPEISIQLPVYLFPVLCLEAETKKGKKFKVYAIGSDRKFRVFGKI